MRLNIAMLWKKKKRWDEKLDKREERDAKRMGRWWRRGRKKEERRKGTLDQRARSNVPVHRRRPWNGELCRLVQPAGSCWSPARSEAHRLRPNASLRQRSEPGTKQQTWYAPSVRSPLCKLGTLSHPFLLAVAFASAGLALASENSARYARARPARHYS